jgi:hypothetical protein
MNIVVASDPERDSVFAEIYDGDAQWAEISFDSAGALRLRVWGAPGPHGSDMDLHQALDAIHEARRRLEGRWMGAADGPGLPHGE